MITKTFTPRNTTNDPYFFFDLPFDGDSKKKYSCRVIESNAPCPEIIGFIYKDVGGINQQHIQLKLAATCNQRQMKVVFMTVSEVVEENKVKFLTWLAGYFVWLNFIFRIFKLNTIKFITKAVFIGIMIPVAFSLIYAGVEFSYEQITGDNFEDSYVVELVNRWTVPKLGKWWREDALDDAEDLRGFLKEKTADAFEATKNAADDAKEAVSDKIEDIRDR